MTRRRYSPLSDPSIPVQRSVARSEGNAKGRAQVVGPATGRLVDYGDGTVMLVDNDGNSWTQDSVRWVGGSFGFGQDGLEVAPRPYLYAATEVLVEGDDLLIFFLNGNGKVPIVMGGVRKLEDSEDGYFNAQAIGQDPNRLAFRHTARDPATDTLLHHLDVEHTGDGKVEIRVGLGPTANSNTCHIKLDASTPLLRIRAGTGDGRTLIDNRLLPDLLASLKEISAALVALGTLPAVLVETTVLIANLAISDTEYLTSTFRAD